MALIGLAYILFTLLVCLVIRVRLIILMTKVIIIVMTTISLTVPTVRLGRILLMVVTVGAHHEASVSQAGCQGTHLT